MKYYKLLAGILGAAMLFSAHNARAEMGLAPEGTSHFYFSGFGGYHYNWGGDNYQNIFKPPPPYLPPVGDGGNAFFGGTIGIMLPALNWGENGRLELTLQGGETSGAEQGATVPVFAFYAQVPTVVVFQDKPEQTITRQWFDADLEFKHDRIISPVFSLTTGAGLYYRRLEDEIQFGVPAWLVFRTSYMASDNLGALVFVEPEYRLSDMFSLVSRLSAGAYFYDVEMQVSYPSHPDVKGNGHGFRSELIGGIKAKNHAATMTIFAGIDFWSDVPIAVHPMNGPGLSTIGTDELVTFKGGINITFRY